MLEFRKPVSVYSSNVGRILTLFPQPSLVTSNLDPRIQKADHPQRGSGSSSDGEKSRNSFVLKILTYKPLGLKILQAIFADPAPVAAFRGVVGGGYTPQRYRPGASLTKRTGQIPDTVID